MRADMPSHTALSGKRHEFRIGKYVVAKETGMLTSMKKLIRLLFIILVGLTGATTFFLSQRHSSSPGQLNLPNIGQVSLPGTGEAGRVKRVVDGDTVQIEANGQNLRVRYIGVDAPESTRTVECFGREAAEFHRKLVAGQELRLERDVSTTDRYGRLLRYAYLPDGRMVNEVLIREGYALARSFPPDVKYQDRLRAAEREARQARRGLWRKCEVKQR